MPSPNIVYLYIDVNEDEEDAAECIELQCAINVNKMIFSWSFDLTDVMNKINILSQAMIVTATQCAMIRRNV